MTVRRYPCPECGRVTEVDEEGEVRRRQIDCPCGAERTVDAHESIEHIVFYTPSTTEHNPQSLALLRQLIDTTIAPHGDDTEEWPDHFGPGN